MSRVFGALRVELLEDTDAGIRVCVDATAHDGEVPRVFHTGTYHYDLWIGITAEPGKAGDIVSVFPPYAGLVMVQVLCENDGVKTGWWANTEPDGYFSCSEGSGQINTGVIVSPYLDEAAAPGKIVKAMIFTGRFGYDAQTT